MFGCGAAGARHMKNGRGRNGKGQLGGGPSRATLGVRPVEFGGLRSSLMWSQKEASGGGHGEAGRKQTEDTMDRHRGYRRVCRGWPVFSTGRGGVEWVQLSCRGRL